MTSSSGPASNALSHGKSASNPRPYPPSSTRSPSERRSDTHSTSKSPSPSEAKESILSSAHGANGDAASTHGQESDAETDILSDHAPPKTTEKKRIMRHERIDRGGPASSPSVRTKSEPSRSNAPSRTSSINGDAAERKERKSNGAERRDNGHSLKNGNGNGRVKSHSTQSGLASQPRRDSVDISSSTARAGSDHKQRPNSEHRKRKRDESRRPSNLEPPRQRPRMDPTPKSASSAHGKERIRSPSSPVTPAVRSHKRSASAQSNLLPPPNSASHKKRRETPTISANDQRPSWPTDSSSESSSPRYPQLLSLQPTRSSHRASIASPARSTMPSRRADRYGSTPLARACEKGDMAAVQKAYEQVPEELDQADNGGFTPLQKAALEGYLNIVEFLLSKGCRKDCQSKDEGDTPLIDAVENRHVEVVKALLNSGVNPHHQNKNGKRAIDAIDFEKPGAEEIEAMLQKAMRDYVDTEDDDEPAENNPQTVSPEDKTRPDLLYLEPSIENLVNYSRKGDTVAVAHFLSSIPPNNECAVVAARGGHIDVLNLLLASGTSLEKDPDPMQHEETPLLAAIGRGHIKVIKLLLEQDNFNPTRKTRDGKTYFELSEQIRGPKWQVERELLRKHYDAYTNRKPKTKRKRSSEGSQAVAAPAHKLTERPSDRAQSPKPRKNLTSKNSSSNVDPSRRKNRPVLESSDSEEDMVRPKKSARRRSSVNSKEGQAPTKVRRMSSVKKSSSVAGASVEPPSPLKTSPDGPVSRESAGKASKPARETSDSVSKKRRKTDHHPNPLQELKVRRDRAAEADRKADDARSAESTRKAAARKIREEERRKREEAERKAREEEQHKAAEEKRKAHEEQERVAAEEERRRKAEEEAQRLEAERLERERVEEERIEQERLEKIRQECERKEREEREKREREEQLLKQLLDGLPPILARSVEYGARNRDNIDISLAINFLPLFTVELWNIDPKCDPARAKEKWILSFFVVGLLNLPDLTLNRFPAWEKRVATLTERKAFLKLYDVSYLTWGQDMPNPFEKEYSWAAAVAANKRTQDQILAMEPLYWVRLEDFRNEFTRVCEVGKIQQELQTVNVKIVTSESHIPKSLDDVFANALGGDGAKDERDPVVEMKVLATETETSAGGAGLAATTTRDVSADVTKDVKPDVEMKDTVQAADADKVKSAEDVVNNAAGDALEAKVEDSKDVVLKG